MSNIVVTPVSAHDLESSRELRFSPEGLQVRAREFLVRYYGKPGQGNDADKWMEKFGLLYAFVDEQFNPPQTP